MPTELKRKVGHRYASHLANCKKQPCPNLTRFRPLQRDSFRFVRDPGSEEDFVPVGVLDGGYSKECGSYALSFFETVELARKKWESLSQREDAEERYGTHLGNIRLMPSDGVMSDPSPQSGHFELHQDAYAVFHTRVTSRAPLNGAVAGLPSGPKGQLAATGPLALLAAEGDEDAS